MGADLVPLVFLVPRDDIGRVIGLFSEGPPPIFPPGFFAPSPAPVERGQEETSPGVLPSPPLPPPDAAPVRLWTPERDAALKRLWYPGIRTAQLVEEIFRLPGAPMPRNVLKAIQNRVGTLGLSAAHRKSSGAAPAPDVADPETAAPVAPHRAPVATHPSFPPLPPAPTAKGQIVTASREAISGWAAQRGIPAVPFDLVRVNRKRRELGLPVFELPASGRAGRATP